MAAGNGRFVSIVIAAYNVGNLIENCILSILAQTYRDYEILIVDGGSTDATLSVCHKFAAADLRIKVTSEKDTGLNDAQWKGIQRASGDWVYFLGADDVLHSPCSLERLFAQCPATLDRIDIITGYALYEDGRLYRSNRPYILLAKNCIHGQGALHRRSLFAQHGYDFSLKVYYDYEFNLWAYTTGKRFHHTKVLLAILGCGGHSDRPRWKNYLEEMRCRGRYVRGIGRILANGGSVARYLYKIVWFYWLSQN